ncbi:hypothetical protein [Synechococcus sp. BIOS-U3-1]|uniref:hypothetical protein n=1 Tax=Synechococcus sp. BIOS-U3-1 TaxID=1400865 RepID=UPI0016450F1B|nr:hypothetical protein [Synechococcus sp. BIOS-U3-1]
MIFQKLQYQILLSVNGEESLDSHHSTLQDAQQRFEYLKDNWQDLFPDGFSAIELVDQYFDQIDQFEPLT